MVTVLVAKQTIPKGTAGSVVASKDLYTVTTIRESQLLEGAMSDPATLRDKVATREIFEGAQLTATDFGAAGDSLAAQLTDRERIVSVPLDSAHGLIDGIEAGNRVDVYAGFNVIPLGADGRPINGGQARPMLRLDPVRRPGRRGRREGARLGLDERQPRGRRRQGGAARLRLRQRQALAGAAAERRREGVAARHRHGRDHAPRRPAGADPEVGRRPSVNSRGFHVYAALEASLGLDAIREALPAGTPLRAVSLAEAGRAGSEIQQGADLVIVGCSQAHEQALEVISAASAQRADRPVVVLYHGSPNGFLERAFEAGADDLVALPQSAGQLGFALEKALARRRGAVGRRPRGDDHRARAEGRHRQDGDVVQPRGRARARGQLVGARRPRPPVRRRRARARAPADEDDLRPRHVGRHARRRQDRQLPRQHDSGARALLAPLRPDQAAAIGTAFLREVFEILRSRYDFVIVDTPPAFTPEVIAAVDASSHLCMVGMLDALSLKDTKIGLETLAEMGYDPRAITLVLNRADSSVGITQLDVEQLLGRAPDVLVGSDRAIPARSRAASRSSVAEPKSKAARSYAAWRSGTWRSRRSRWPRPTTTGGGGCCCGRRADDGAARADRELAGRAGALAANGNGTAARRTRSRS